MVTKAGAMRDKVDILTAPSSETSRSSHGTVAARPTEGESCENDEKSLEALKLTCEEIKADSGQKLNNIEHPEGVIEYENLFATSDN